MCGIVALLARQPSSDLLLYLLSGLRLLQNRGYDSCGGMVMATTTTEDEKEGKEGVVSWSWKGASTATETALERLEAAVAGQEARAWQCGMFHTRWATHGPKTDQNAHPHTDATGRFSVVHNGILTNAALLRSRLVAKGYVFRSDTDTEVVAHMLVDCCQALPTASLLTVWQAVVSQLEGTWSLVVCDREHPTWLYVAKHGSPLVLAYSEDHQLLGVASELSGLCFPSQHYHEVPDESVFVVNEQFYLFESENNLPVASAWPLLTSGNTSTALYPKDPSPYRFWTEGEIRQQPEALWAALNHGGRLHVEGGEWCLKLGGLERHREALARVRHLVLVGCGTSWHAAQFASRVFRTVTALATVQVFDASELTWSDVRHLPPSEVALVLVSQSGETKDCQRVLTWARTHSLLTVGVVNVVSSWLARHTDCGVYLNAGREVGVASTKSFTSQCVVLTLLALWLGQDYDQREWGSRVYRCSDVVACNMESLAQHARLLVSSVSCQRSLFLLGRGYSQAIAWEGALKLKELTTKNVEGYAGGALKHGPFAVLGPDAVVFLSCWEGPDWDSMVSAAEQVTSRGAQVVVLHNRDPTQAALLQSRFPYARLVPLVEASDEWTAALVSVVFYQWLAFYVALDKGLNPDQPRHLAKVVTVDG